MKTSFSQVIVAILVQLAFYVLGQPLNTVKLFTFALIDAMVIMVAVCEWYGTKLEWQLWVKEIYGESK